MIRIMARGSTMMVLVISICFLVPKAAALPHSRDSCTIPTGDFCP
jgi:hypothetical protein